ncbi:hypothetical protein Tco_0657614 [Tanacetum coccineum]
MLARVDSEGGKRLKKRPGKMIAKVILQEEEYSGTQHLTLIENAIANVIPFKLMHHQQYQLYIAMIVNPQLQQQDIAIWLALQMKFKRNTILQTACGTPAVRPRDQDDPHDDAHPKGENSAKRQKTSEYEAYVSGESSSG